MLISDAVLYSYGSNDGPNRFSSALDHFNLTSKHLSNCDLKLESKDCTTELINELKLLKNPTIILILNKDSSMPNFYLEMIVQYFSINAIKAYRNALTEKHGLNIIADSKYLLEFLNQKDGKWTKMAQMSEEMFCDVETWRDHDIVGKIIFQKWPQIFNFILIGSSYQLTRLVDKMCAPYLKRIFF